MDHGGHGGMDMGPRCAMNMLWYYFCVAADHNTSPDYSISVLQEHTGHRYLRCLPRMAHIIQVHIHLVVLRHHPHIRWLRVAARLPAPRRP